MVFDKFLKKRKEQHPQPRPALPQASAVVNEVKSTLSSLLQSLSKLEQRIDRVEHELVNLKRILEGYFIIQLSTLPSSLADLARLLGLRGAVLLVNSNEVERYGEIKEDYRSIISSIDFSTILHVDKNGTRIYVLKHGNKILYMEVERDLDNYTLALIKKFLEYF